MRSLLANLRGLFFCFQCLPGYKASARWDTSPLLDDAGNPQEELGIAQPFAAQVPANSAQGGSSPRYEAIPDAPSRKCSSICALL